MEPRGADFYQDGGSKGPDTELTINREKTYSGVRGRHHDRLRHANTPTRLRQSTNRNCYLLCLLVDFQDCLDDIGQEPGSVGKAVAAYEDEAADGTDAI